MFGNNAKIKMEKIERDLDIIKMELANIKDNIQQHINNHPLAMLDTATTTRVTDIELKVSKLWEALTRDDARGNRIPTKHGRSISRRVFGS